MVVYDKWHKPPEDARLVDYDSFEEIAGKFLKAQMVLKELFELLEDHQPPWYLRRHHNRIVEAIDGKSVGYLVVFPCKVGDSVWFITADGIGSGIVKWFETNENGEWAAVVFDPPKGPFFYDLDSFGKAVFVTHEEAEQALNR